MTKDIFDKDKSPKAKRRYLCLVIVAALLFTFSAASAQTTLILKVEKAPENLSLGDVILMNPGDMEDLGLSGGEVIKICRADDPVPKRCVELRAQYGAGVTSGSVVMDTEKLEILGLEPKKSFTLEITLTDKR